ncbi:MAG: DNA damage-inducible protein D [Clostridia bacterium]|jgi:DNA-damage-inducible protein D|nr:DNA damage-inducible protein D [Clostridia bacterium]
MEDSIMKITEENFESIKHIDENGIEFWYARELMVTLEYNKWGNFVKVITKAKDSCQNTNISVFEHFADVGKTIKMPKGAEKRIDDLKLTRYACYLVAQNGDSRKKAIALAQTYFAVQTRKQEISRQEYEQLSEDEKRLYTRQNVKDKNKYLFDTARMAGVKNYGKFNNYGYRGLYNGENAKDIAVRKGISEKEDILDYMSSTELAANLFRITQTDEVLKNKNIDNENDACKTHHNVGQAVRQTIKRIGGTMPEDLSTPSKSAKEVEKEKKIKRLK